MRFLTITDSISIKPDWANISGEILKAGTPLSIVGTVADSSSAVGILANDAHLGDAEVNVVVSGMIDLGEITASYGELTDDAIAAMKGISFVDGGSVVTPSGGGGSGGDIFVVTVTQSGGAFAADKTYNEIVEATQAGKICIVNFGGAGNAFLLYQPSPTNTFIGTIIQVIIEGGALVAVNIVINSDNTVTLQSGTYILTAAS